MSVLRSFAKCFNSLHHYTFIQAVQKQIHFQKKLVSTYFYNDRDPAPVFFDSTVQTLLHNLTGKEMDKIFRHRYNEVPLKPPNYEFVTEEIYNQSLKEAEETAESLLQMPPVLKLRAELDKILHREPIIAGQFDHKIVFTDISSTASDRDRLVVVRETSGDLRLADWEERRRMNAIYNPLPHRSVFKPKFFLKENVEFALERKEYVFVLDNSCYQLDPDDPDYQQTVAMTYEAVDEKMDYEVLRSTRHFGPFCFYLVWNRCCDNIMSYFLKKEMLSEAVDLIKLYHTIHLDSKSLSICQNVDDDTEFIKSYIENDALQKPKLHLALHSYLELLKAREDHIEDKERMHNTSSNS